MKLQYLAIILLLAGCTTKPAEIQTVTVKVEVPVPCKVNLGTDPAYPDGDAELAKIPFPRAEALLLANPVNPVALQQVGSNLLYLISHYRAGRNMRAARDVQKQVALDKCGENPPPAKPERRAPEAG
jgi:hypothetical protein